MIESLKDQVHINMIKDNSEISVFYIKSALLLLKHKLQICIIQLQFCLRIMISNSVNNSLVGLPSIMINGTYYCGFPLRIRKYSLYYLLFVKY